MAKPNDIPQDIWLAAFNAFNQAPDPADAQTVTARAIMAERERFEAEWAAHLSDPVVVHMNMLRGSIAKLTASQLIHLYGTEFLASLTNGEAA